MSQMNPVPALAVVEPGTFDVMVGTSSEHLTTVTLEVTKEPQT